MEPPITPSNIEQGTGPPEQFSALSDDKQLAYLRAAVASANKPLTALAATIDGLHGQTTTNVANGEIEDLHDQLSRQDQIHKEGILEIQGILDDLLQNEVVEDMRKQVEQEIAAQIDELVKEQVVGCLKAHIPRELQEEVAESRRELEELNLALHNSESRRTNGNLRSNKADDSLATLFMPGGSVSPNFPVDLKSLFSLDAEGVKTLMTDYGLPNISDSRDHNLNRLMQFCGVRYQLVGRLGAEKH